MGQLLKQGHRVRRRSYGAQTAQLVTVAASVLAIYGMCSIMLLTTYKAEGEPTSQYPSVSRSKNLAWHGGALKGNRRLLMSIHSPRHAMKQQQTTAATQQEQWAQFWASDVPQGLASLQALRVQFNLMKYQQLQKDLEPQNTAGLDIAVADTLHHLGQYTHLDAAQAWLKEQVTAHMSNMLHSLQHPANCSAARQLLCNLNKPCGFGCQLHHVVHCLTHAVALNRTLVMQTNPWRYSPGQNGQKTWEELMEPVSNCSVTGTKGSAWPAIRDGAWHNEAHVVRLDIIDSAQTSLDPPSMPPDVLQVSQLFSTRPDIWWIGVLTSYLLRPSAESQQRLAKFRASNGWQSPIVGVHIRRTDKVTSAEAKLHSIDEYMMHVERFCDWRLGAGWQQEQTDAAARAAAEVPMTAAATASGTSSVDSNATADVFSAQAPDRCTIYLATDEPAVAMEIESRFAHIHVITNKVALDTGSVSARNSVNGAVGIYDDTMHLAASDFLVGTFSSQISRLAYEVAAANGSMATDSSLHYHSVDSVWYFGGMRKYEFCTTHDFSVAGDLIVGAGQHVLCDVIFPFKDGCMLCNLLQPGTGTSPVHLPPAILGPCSKFHNTDYRPLLPAYMQRPDATVAVQPVLLT